MFQNLIRNFLERSRFIQVTGHLMGLIWMFIMLQR